MAAKFILLSDAEKKLLSDRYLDLQFEQDIDNFICVRCNRLVIVHFFTNCDHLLCLNCKRIIDNGGFTCPQCNTLIINASEHRDEFERQLLALRTKCPNTKYGCQLTTNLAQIPEHVRMCKFTREQALPALSTESNTMFRVLDKINEHNGQIVELKLEITKLNESIVALDKYKEDLKMEIKSLKSEVNIERRKQQEDSNQFKNEIAGDIQIIKTNLKKLIGDEFRAMKEDMKQINLENSTIKKEMASISEKIKDMEQQEHSNKQLPKNKNPIEEFLSYKSSMNQLVNSFLFGAAEDKMVIESLCLKWKIKHKDILIPKEGSHEHLSDIFPIYGYQLYAQLMLTVYSHGDIKLNLCFKDEERKGQEVDIKPLPMVTFIIKDLCGHNKHIIRYYHYSFSKSLQFNKFGYWSYNILKSQWKALISPRDNSMEVLVLVEPRTIINNPLSVDGTITDTIEFYSRKLQMAKEELIDGHWSPSFLTHAGGFRVAVQLYLDESTDDNKRGLEAWIRFLSGEYDFQLESEFEHETSVTLINPWDANNNLTVKQQAKEAESYCITIASWNKISSGGFIVNDLLTYHVTIIPMIV